MSVGVCVAGGLNYDQSNEGFSLLLERRTALSTTALFFQLEGFIKSKEINKIKIGKAVCLILELYIWISGYNSPRYSGENS